MGLKVTAKGKEPPKEPKDGQNFMHLQELVSDWCKNLRRSQRKSFKNVHSRFEWFHSSEKKKTHYGKSNAAIIFHISRSPFPIRIFLFIFPGKKGIRLLLINAIPTPFKAQYDFFFPSLLSKWRFVWWHSSQKKWYRKSEGYLYTWHVLFL